MSFTKLNKTNSNFQLILLLLVLIAGFIVGYYHGHQTPSIAAKTENEVNKVDKVLPKNYLSVLNKTYSSPDPNDTREIVVRQNDKESGHSIYLKEKGKEEEIDEALLPGNVGWSPSSVKIAYSAGTPSSGYNVRIIDIPTKKKLWLGAEQKLFTRSAENQDYVFGHIYSRNVVWLDDKYLIVGVNGYPDASDYRPRPQFFLINANTGNIIKRIRIWSITL